MSSAEDIATGGQRSRDMAQRWNMPGRWCLYGELGQLAHEFDAGGPLDAPDTLPAGSVDGLTWCDGRGRALAHQTEVRRAG